MIIENKKVAFEDGRGTIIDIVEKENIESVTIITSKKGTIRGNHYHKETVQYTYVLKGTLKFYTQMPDEEVETAIVKAGDLVLTPPVERHAVFAVEDSECLILTRGPRGGQNYEQDTFRLDKSLVP